MLPGADLDRILQQWQSAQQNKPEEVHPPPAVAWGVQTLFTIQILFLVLKFCGVLRIPWVWVMSPFWLPVAVVFVVSFVLVIWDNRKGKRNE